MNHVIELNIRDFVYANRKFYFVNNADCDKNTASLVSVEYLDEYHGDESGLDALAIQVPARQIKHLNPVSVDENVLRRLFRMEATPWQLAKEGMFPFNYTTRKLCVTEEDVFALISNLQRIPNIAILWTWVHTFIPSAIEHCYAQYPEQDSPGFSLAFFCEEVISILNNCDFSEDYLPLLIELRDGYLQSKEKPISETVIPDFCKYKLLVSLEKYAQAHKIENDVHDYYITLLDELTHSEMDEALQAKAYTYFTGNKLVVKDWSKAEGALLHLFSTRKKAYDALLLGYIYSEKESKLQDYAKAFKYFTYAAEHNIIEAYCMLADLYKDGKGIPQNSETAWHMISQLYEANSHQHRDASPSIALRMGYCYRDGIGIEKDKSKAYWLFIEAYDNFKLQTKHHQAPGDRVLLQMIIDAIQSVAAPSPSFQLHIT